MVYMMNILRHLPAIHQLKAHARFSQIALKLQVSEDVLTEWLHEQVDMIRNKIRNKELTDEKLDRNKLLELIIDEI